MDQTFNFRAAPVPLRRRVRPGAIALGLAACIVLSGLVMFGRWVADSERRSFERARAAEATIQVVGTLSGSDVAAADVLVDPLSIDTASRADARSALGAARQAAKGRATFLDAGPGQLTPLVASLVFVDGPSPAPGVVSVASTEGAWGAAVMGPSGTCYLVRFAPRQGVTYGSDDVEGCTGAAALTGAREPSW